MKVVKTKTTTISEGVIKIIWAHTYAHVNQDTGNNDFFN